MKSILRFAPVALVLLTNDAHAFVKMNNYVQTSRGHRFMRIDAKGFKFGSNFSRDLDELDAYQLDDQWIQAPHMDRVELNSLEKPVDYVGDVMDLETVGGRLCSVAEEGPLSLSWVGANFFDQKPHTVRIVAEGIEVEGEGEGEGPAKGTPRLIPFDSIKIPIETIDETRECWNLKTDEGKIIMCEKNREGRDVWIHNILKALFCYNSNSLHIEEMKRQQGPVQLSKHSTVDKRLQEKQMDVYQQVDTDNETKRKMNPNYSSVDLIEPDGYVM